MNNTLRICTWNANSVRNKLGELIHFLSREKIDIMLITEIKLKRSKSVDITQQGGGVAILVSLSKIYRTKPLQ